MIFGHMKLFCFQSFSSSRGDSVPRQVEFKFVVIDDDDKTGTDEASASKFKIGFGTSQLVVCHLALRSNLVW